MHRNWRKTADLLPGWFSVVAMAFVMSMLFIDMTDDYLPLMILEEMHSITDRVAPSKDSQPFMRLLMMSLFLYVLLIVAAALLAGLVLNTALRLLFRLAKRDKTGY